MHLEDHVCCNQDEIDKLKSDNEQLRRLVEDMRMALVVERNLLLQTEKKLSEIIQKSYNELP